MTTKNQKTKPIAVLISDVHYSLKTLELADKAMRLAIAKANDSDVPLIVAGDLHDTKANMRAECVSAMIKTFRLCSTNTYILRGNHDAVNEKSEDHALDFLRGVDALVSVIDEPHFDMLGKTPTCFIPYFHDTETLRQFMTGLDKGEMLIMHQGISGSNSGEYFQDHSALRPEDVAGMRVISGHYHARQDIKLPDGGLWSYIGNPYTLNFGEANDPPKGFQVLYSDGSLEFVPTNLRKHVKIEVDCKEKTVFGAYGLAEDDLVWVKALHADASISKSMLASLIGIKGDFRLELIPDEVELTVDEAPKSNDQVLDGIIESATNVTDDQKARVKALWKNLVTKDVK